MKKLLTFILILAMMLTFTICVCAEETGATESEQIVEETSSTLTRIWTIAGSAGIGTVFVALIVFFVGNFKKIQSFMSSFGTIVKNIFSKDGNIENVPQAFGELKGGMDELALSFEAKLKEVRDELADDKTKQDQVMQILIIFIMNCTNVDKYAKSEMIQLMTGTKEFGENWVESIKRIAESIETAKANEEKTETPYLDKITSEVK